MPYETAKNIYAKFKRGDVWKIKRFKTRQRKGETPKQYEERREMVSRLNETSRNSDLTKKRKAIKVGVKKQITKKPRPFSKKQAKHPTRRKKKTLTLPANKPVAQHEPASRLVMQADELPNIDHSIQMKRLMKERHTHTDQTPERNTGLSGPS
jgi:hypothetical protein